MPFQPGQSGNPCGRPKGSRNKNSLAVREWATAIVEDPKVQARLLADARTGNLHPAVGQYPSLGTTPPPGGTL